MPDLRRLDAAALTAPRRLVLALTLGLGGCATHLSLAESALRAGRYDEAAVNFARQISRSGKSCGRYLRGPAQSTLSRVVASLEAWVRCEAEHLRALIRAGRFWQAAMLGRRVRARLQAPWPECGESIQSLTFSATDVWTKVCRELDLAWRAKEPEAALHIACYAQISSPAPFYAKWESRAAGEHRERSWDEEKAERATLTCKERRAPEHGPGLVGRALAAFEAGDCGRATASLARAIEQRRAVPLRDPGQSTYWMGLRDLLGVAAGCWANTHRREIAKLLSSGRPREASHLARRLVLTLRALPFDIYELNIKSILAAQEQGAGAEGVSMAPELLDRAAGLLRAGQPEDAGPITLWLREALAKSSPELLARAKALDREARLAMARRALTSAREKAKAGDLSSAAALAAEAVPWPELREEAAPLLDSVIGRAWDADQSKLSLETALPILRKHWRYVSVLPAEAPVRKAIERAMRETAEAIAQASRSAPDALGARFFYARIAAAIFTALGDGRTASAAKALSNELRDRLLRLAGPGPIEDPRCEGDEDPDCADPQSRLKAGTRLWRQRTETRLRQARAEAQRATESGPPWDAVDKWIFVKALNQASGHATEGKVGGRLGDRLDAEATRFFEARFGERFSFIDNFEPRLYAADATRARRWATTFTPPRPKVEPLPLPAPADAPLESVDVIDQ